MKLKAVILGAGFLAWGINSYSMEKQNKGKRASTTKGRSRQAKNNQSKKKLLDYKKKLLYIPDDKKTLLRNMYVSTDSLHKRLSVTLGHLERAEEREKQMVVVLKQLTENQEAITTELAEQKKEISDLKGCITEQSKQIAQLLTLVTKIYNPFGGKIASNSRLNNWIGNAGQEKEN